jgi:large conductance mechanosensitive channel
MDEDAVAGSAHRARHGAGDPASDRVTPGWRLIMWKEFRDFIARGNVMDLAVGVIIGAAFGKIVGTLVEGVLMPPLGLLLGQVDFSSLFVVLGTSTPTPTSLAHAKELGVPVIAYGQLINDLVNFLIVALAVFLVVKQVNRIKSAVDRPAPAAAPTTKDCPFCASVISIKATRCPQCTSALA